MITKTGDTRMVLGMLGLSGDACCGHNAIQTQRRATNKGKSDMQTYVKLK